MHPGPLFDISNGYTEEHWKWDADTKSPAAQLSSCQQVVCFHTDPVTESEGTAGVRGTKGFTQGEHYWEIIFVEPPYGVSVMTGIGTKKAPLHAGNHQYINMLGMDCEGWGFSYKGTIWHAGQQRKYTKPFYDKMTVIGVHLNLYQGTLTFYQNGKNLGVAFTNLDKIREPLYPIVCSTAPETELQLGVRRCRFISLREQCLYTILQNLEDKINIDNLPLPVTIRGQLKEF
ncbi:SPRY domain-containing SOCS box protein 3 [Protopterus annectens]|uniref:SPRY domain-containing SOCS box protein 3 n=1 Tax=Protopterus annectens TaxID=7888 RepID=UPI001CFBA3E7|nr:SPRY domain-containing SOCS box protein 3 [Protopterus annectens]